MEKKYYFTIVVIFITSLLIVAPFLLNAVGSTTFQLVIDESSSPAVVLGGGSPSAPISPISGSLILSGRSAPGATISITRDGAEIGTVTSDSRGDFRATFTNINPGTYDIGLQAANGQGEGRLVATLAKIEQQQDTYLDMGVLAPIISITRSLGSNRAVAVQGASVPGEQHIIMIQDHNSATMVQYLVSTDELGIFTKDIDLSDYTQGVYLARVSIQGNDDIYGSQQFLVGEKGVIQKDALCKRADLNCDQRVNLVDFSIAAFWYGKILPDTMREVESTRLNGDGKIDLVDFSIMAFYWND